MTSSSNSTGAETPAEFSDTVDLLSRFSLAPINPECQDLEEGDLIDYAPPLGRSEVRVRLLNHPWLANNLAQYWPAGSDSPYINAYAAVARMLTTAVALATSNPEDLAYALSLPRAFVYSVVAMLDSAEWHHFMEEMKKQRGLDGRCCEAAVGRFVADLSRESIYLLRVLGPSLYPPESAYTDKPIVQ